MPIDWQAIQTFLLAILTFIGYGTTKYLEEKSKNLATKQDTAEITAKIESIRAQYAKQSLVQKLSFEKEFEILSELWKTLVDLRGATQSLRPILDYSNPQETEEERRKKRIQHFSESFNIFAAVVDKNKPFYPKEVFDTLFEILMIARNEAEEYWHHDPERRPLDQQYWDNALKNQQAIIAKVDKVCDLIRQRIVA